jgi:hypothetical protein
MKRPSRIRVVACLAIGVALFVSCGDDDDSASTVTTADTAGEATTAAPTTTSVPTTVSSTPGSGTASGDSCAEAAALRESVDALKDVDVRAEGSNGVTAAVDAVKQDLEAVRGSVSTELQPEVEAVQGALDEVEAAAADLGSGGAVSTVTAVSNLVTAARTLLDSLDAGGCDSPTTTA